MNRLTPWCNDPVSDPPGEVGLPARRGDRASSGRRRPCRAGAARPTTVRHGQGYTRFTRTEPRPGAGPAACWSRPTTRSSWSACACATPATGRGACRRRSTPSGCSAAVRDQAPLAGRVLAPTRRPAPCWPATPGRATSPGRSPSPPWPRSAVPAHLHRRPRPSSWAATARRTAPAALGRVAACPAAPGRLSTRAPPCMTPIDAGRRARTEEIVFVLGQAETPERGAATRPRPTPPPGRVQAGAGRGAARSGTACWAPFR